jgi:hypothetical protein
MTGGYFATLAMTGGYFAALAMTGGYFAALAMTATPLAKEREQIVFANGFE